MTTNSPAPGAADPLEALMTRMAAGDSAAIFELHKAFEGRIEGCVRKHLSTCGVDRPDADDVHSLAVEVCVELADIAGAWRPGGALPWVWAHSRVRACVVRHVGIHADSIDDDRRSWVEPVAPSAVTASGRADDLAGDFARLRAADPMVALYDQARRQAGVSEADLVVWLDYRSQKAQGDPSPANTLADALGVSPQTLRKRMSRTAARLRDVIEVDPAYAALTEFAYAS